MEKSSVDWYWVDACAQNSAIAVAGGYTDEGMFSAVGHIGAGAHNGYVADTLSGNDGRNLYSIVSWSSADTWGLPLLLL